MEFEVIRKWAEPESKRPQHPKYKFWTAKPNWKVSIFVVQGNNFWGSHYHFEEVYLVRASSKEQAMYRAKEIHSFIIKKMIKSVSAKPFKKKKYSARKHFADTLKRSMKRLRKVVIPIYKRPVNFMPLDMTGIQPIISKPLKEIHINI